MYHSATIRLFAVAAFAAALHSQVIPEWRRIGSSVIAAGLASPAGGVVSRVWYSSDGRTLYARLPSGRTFSTQDGEKWSAAIAEPPGDPSRVAAARLSRGTAYRVDTNVWRSSDGGDRWSNVTQFRDRSILGGQLNEIAVSPANEEEIVVAGADGIWRSVDGGASWTGLNEGLPNLPLTRLIAAGPDVVRALTGDGLEIDWPQGNKGSWIPTEDSVLAEERGLAARLGATSIARAGDIFYAGYQDGRMTVSSDRGVTWLDSPRVESAGRIERIFTDTRDPAFALAVTGSTAGGRVLRTVNRGAFWDDITADLPPGAVHGTVADRLTGAVYVASEAGVFVTYTDTRAAAPATPWTRLREESARDVLLDSAGNQLYVALEGAGVYATLAPHRTRDPRVVSAGDQTLRPAAPGGLLSVLGARVSSAQAGERSASVLAASDEESQVQLPWELPGNGVMVSLTAAGGRRIQIGLPVTPTAPSIFVDKDGSPLLMDGDTGLMLDSASPAGPRTRLQILASGLGRVSPDWPAGMAAPLQDPPRVVAPVRVFLDREPLEVVRASLAPGYVGLYLVEVQLPAILNRGTAELFIEAGGAGSNRVRIWLEP